MSITRARWVAALATLSAVALPVSAHAQSGTAAGLNDQQQSQALQPIEPQAFVTAASQGNQFEIASSRLVANSSGNRTVRRIARDLIRDHTAQQRQLAAVAAQLGLQVPATDSVSTSQQAVLQRLQARRGVARDRAYLRAQVTAHEQAIVLHEQAVLTPATPAALRQLATLALPVLGGHLVEVRLARTGSA